MFEYTTQSFNVLFRHLHRCTVGADDVDDTRNLKYPQALGGRDANKQVTGEKRQLHFRASFFPAVNCMIEGQKRFHRSSNQFLGYNFLVPGNNVDRVPVSFQLLVQRALTLGQGLRYLHNGFDSGRSFSSSSHDFQSFATSTAKFQSRRNSSRTLVHRSNAAGLGRAMRLFQTRSV